MGGSKKQRHIPYKVGMWLKIKPIYSHNHFEFIRIRKCNGNGHYDVSLYGDDQKIIAVLNNRHYNNFYQYTPTLSEKLKRL